MEYVIIVGIVLLIAYAVYDQKYKPRHKKCPECGKNNFGRYAVDAEVISEDQLPETGEGIDEWKTICKYHTQCLNEKVPYEPVKVTTHFRCKDCGHEDVVISYSHTDDYNIGMGMHDVRWGMKVYSGKAYTKACNGLKRRGY